MKGRATIFSSASPLAKRYSLDGSGTLVKGTAAHMSRGMYHVAEFTCAETLSALLDKVTTEQAVCCSLPLDQSESGEVVTRKELLTNKRPDAKARTKGYFGLMPTPGVLFIDHDSGGLSRDELWQMLVAAVPALANAGVVWRPSGSSHICNGSEDLTGLRGQHLWVLLVDASDGPRVIKTLADRLWLAGHGSVLISSAGSLLLRCPVDIAPSDAARLVFAGGAITMPPLEQRRGPPVILNNGGWLDSVRAVPDLTDAEQARCIALKEQAKEATTPEALQRRAVHRAEMVAARVPELMGAGASAAEAEKRLSAAMDAAFAGVLLSDFELTVVHDDGRREAVTVGEVLSDRDRWHEVDCLDPLNPSHRHGTPDCRLFIHGASPIAYSLDDGGRVYRLRSQQRRLAVAQGARSELVTQLADVVAELDQVFMTDTGPVLIDQGRRIPLSIERLMNLVGTEVSLFTRGKDRIEVPTDLKREVASLVLSALPLATPKRGVAA